MIIDFILFAAALSILFKMLSAISGFSHQKWAGRKIKFSMLTLSHACVGAGAVGVATGVLFGAPMLLLGVAGVMLVERRGMR